MPPHKPRPSGEDRIIARYFRPLATHPGAFRLTDDAAALTPSPGNDLVLTVDAIVGGVHFLPDDPPDAVAKKALRVNLSDLAAKGARPGSRASRAGLPPMQEPTPARCSAAIRCARRGRRRSRSPPLARCGKAPW